MQPSLISVAGAVLHVQQLGDGDLPAIERHLLRLGPLDRRARFLSSPADEVIRVYTRQLDPLRVILVGAVDLSKRLVGLAEAHLADTVAEVGVSIDVAFRRHGLARSLVSGVLALVFGRSVQSAEFVFSPDNPAIAVWFRSSVAEALPLTECQSASPRTAQNARRCEPR